MQTPQSHTHPFTDGPADRHYDTVTAGDCVGKLALEVEARGPDGSLRGAIHVAETAAASDQRNQTRTERLPPDLRFTRTGEQESISYNIILILPLDTVCLCIIPGSR